MNGRPIIMAPGGGPPPRSRSGIVATALISLIIGYLVGARTSGPTISDCTVLFQQHNLGSLLQNTGLVNTVHTDNNNAQHNSNPVTKETVAVVEEETTKETKKTKKSKPKKTDEKSSTSSTTPAIPSHVSCPVCTCPEASKCPDVPACPSMPASVPVAQTGVQGSLGLTYWRQVAYTMAPFVFPQLYACSRTPAELPGGDNYRSQSNEDRWLWDGFFSKLPNDESWGGTFIEIGALDGQTFSNSWFFEKTRDWRGLLIEGHPSNSVSLRESQGMRSSTAIFTMAICGFTATGAPGTLGFTNNGGAVGTAVEEANEKFLRGWHGGQTTGSFPIDCTPLQALLDITGVLDVDFFSLDVEGGEYLVLQTIDWEVTNIRVILVELDGGDPVKDDKVRTFLQGKGFIPSPWGKPRDGCTPGRDCTSNDAFVNPNYMERKRARIAPNAAGVSPVSPFHPSYANSKYKYGSAQKC